MAIQPWRYLLVSTSLLLMMVSSVSAQSLAPSGAPSIDLNATEAPSSSVMPSPAPSPVVIENTTSTPTASPTAIFVNATDDPSIIDSTLLPTVNETNSPSASPSVSPTSTNFTDVPTTTPTLAPSAAPSSPMVNETTTEPSAAPSSAPSAELQQEFVEDLNIRLFGISDLPVGAPSDAFQDITAAYQQQFYASVLNSPISDFSAEVTIQKIVVPNIRRHLRDLQADESVTVIYSQTMQYRVTGAPGSTNVGPIQVATVPFDSEAGRNAYVEMLQNSGQVVLADVTSVSPVETETTPEPTLAPAMPPSAGGDGSGEKGLSTGAIVGIAVGGGVALIGLLYFFFFRSGDNDYEGANDPPPSVNVQRETDEVSTLAPPPLGPGGAPMSHGSIGGYGDQSVTTVDYDYSKAYGGGGDTSVVSSAGGTFGSQTHGQSVLDPRTAGATGAALGNFSDDNSFEAAYRDPNANVKEELLNIFAPPGKLGVVIDTPDDGAPVVHAVKDSSVIAGKINVGDKLVAVDDEDVRSMTAIKVSKLISRKSANPSRKLTIIRMTVIE